MSKFDRGSFKPTLVKENIEADEKLNESMGKGNNQGDFITLKDGKNLIRLYPPHPEAGGKVYAEPKVTVYLPIAQAEFKDGQPVLEAGKPKMVLKPKSIYNSRQHGGTKKDAVEVYNELVEKKAVSLFPGEWKTKAVADKRKEFLEGVRGDWEKKIGGTQYRSSWVAYADHRITFDSKPSFGRFEMGVAIKERLNKIAISVDGADDVLTTDPFTDVDEGRGVWITKNPTAKPADYYTTDIDNTSVPTEIQGKMYPLPRLMPLSDEQLESFMKLTPLVEIYQNCFTRKDLLLQIEGLQNIDKQFGYKIFEDPEFIAVIEELQEIFPAGEESENENSNAAAVRKEEERENIQGDEFDLFSRQELVDYILENDLNIVPKKSYGEDKLKELIREYLKNGSTPSVETEVEKEEVSNETEEEGEKPEETTAEEQPQETEEESDVVVEKESKPETDVKKDRLQALRDKAKGNSN